MGPELTIEITEKRFAGLAQPLFEDFRLHLSASHILALLGPSGIGKSTLLRLVAGIDRNFKGRIGIAGRPPAGAGPAGFVFQDARLLPWLTVTGNIVRLCPSADAGHVRRTLQRVGLDEFRDAYPHQLSGGMQRRVAIARALTANSRFWLFDEPFVSLDRRTMAGLQHLLVDLIASEAPTVLLVSHMPEQAAYLAHRAVVLAGRPARIAADVTLAGTPGQRQPTEVTALTEALAGHMDPDDD